MTLKTYMNKYLEWIISFIVLLPVSISFILNPLTNDSKIYQGLAKITDYFGTFPSNIDLAWEVKPIANRGINYLLYKVGSLVTTFGTTEYEMVIKFLSIVIVLLICYYFSTKVKNKYIFLILGVAFLTPLNFSVLQAEWWACLFTFLSLGLFLTDKKSNHYLAGAIITIIFLFKGITIFLVAPIICFLYLTKPDWFDRLKIGAYGSIMLLAFIVFCGYFKNVIPDLLLSASIAHVGKYDTFTMITNLIYNFPNIYLYIPIFFAGLLALLYLFIKSMGMRDLKTVGVITIMWLSAVTIVYMQSEFFIYHYIVFLVPSILTLILLDDKFTKISIVAILIIFFAFTSYWSYGMSMENAFWENTSNGSVDLLKVYPDLQTQSSILYLDPGNAPYYFQSNSSCRYITPLPFQRSDWDWDLSNTPQYQEQFDCIINYQGKYIVTDAGTWFWRNTSDSRLVKTKVDIEYEQVWNKGWNIYRRI